MTYLTPPRDSLAAQLEITLTKADSEQLARSIAEEQYSDLEKEKIMKELELKEMMARHKQELIEKDITIGSVSQPWFFCFWRAVVGCIGRELLSWLSAFENTEFN